jgi:outer membrane lipoprotein SlyB
MTGERVYRITLHTDDGRTQTITQEWAPSFATGDRVRLNNGAIQR